MLLKVILKNTYKGRNFLSLSLKIGLTPWLSIVTNKIRKKCKKSLAIVNIILYTYNCTKDVHLTTYILVRVSNVINSKVSLLYYLCIIFILY